ncbi:site-specific integrase [Herbaspirillum camelliae]|uniref:site-specific integrase n=1 Tax=Herbaspirillum camelliae TaxID=1892903 RepID=UPI00117BAFC8|nr:site-specific integrase [Herbaspirillum camelliae]
MATKSKRAVEVLTSWVDRYAGTPNTCRAYQRELERVQAWLLGQKLTFESVTQADLERYLHAFASGETLATRPGTKSLRTLSFTRDVLLRMMAELERHGIRIPRTSIELKLPTDSPKAPSLTAPSQQEVDEWDALRQQWHNRPQLKAGSRDPLERQFFVAEFVFCMALSSQELADGVMSDFLALDGIWQLRVRQKNMPTEKYVHVPAPAMAMLKRYRESRGLSSYPDASETAVPIVSRLRSERRVNGWAISKCLSQLSKSPDVDSAVHRIRISSRLLRRYLIVRSLLKKVDERSLRKHVRSDYAVNAVSAVIRESGNSLAQSLVM